MPTIISGLDPSVRMNAYLAGQKFQTQIQEQQAEEQREAARQRAELIKTMQSYRAQQAKALEDVNARAQMGDAQAIQQQILEAQAAGLPPDQRMAQEAVGLLSKITSPEARAKALPHVQGYLEALQKQKQIETAISAVDKAIQDGHISPEEGEALKAEAQSGRGPGVVAGSVTDIVNKKAAGALAMQENEDFAARAEQLLQSAPKGTKSARRAGFAVQKYRNSPTDQQSPGAGAALLKAVQDALILESGEETAIREQTQAKHQKIKSDIAPKVWREFFSTAPVKPGGPFVAHAAGSGSAQKATQKSLKRTGKGGSVATPKASIQDIATSIPDPRSGALELERQGYDLGDPEVQRAIREAYGPVQR